MTMMMIMMAMAMALVLLEGGVYSPWQANFRFLTRDVAALTEGFLFIP